MKRENPPSSGANKTNPSPGLTLDSTSVWQKRQNRPDAPRKPAQTWARYIDSRLKQFASR